MLRDGERIEAYRRAILGNRSSFAGKVVLEAMFMLSACCLDCGLYYCAVRAQAGAAIVYAVDAESYCVDMTRHQTVHCLALAWNLHLLQPYCDVRQTAAANKVSDIIHPIHGKVEDIVLPVQVDIIISEWMGALALEL
eukprot:4620721-Amphidinium_carterae.1